MGLCFVWVLRWFLFLFDQRSSKVLVLPSGMIHAWELVRSTMKWMPYLLVLWLFRNHHLLTHSICWTLSVFCYGPPIHLYAMVVLFFIQMSAYGQVYHRLDMMMLATKVLHKRFLFFEHSQSCHGTMVLLLALWLSLNTNFLQCQLWEASCLLCLVLGSWQYWTTQDLLSTHVRWFLSSSCQSQWIKA